jgi:glycosyltransferase involved in cell wall biosynthesis
MSTHKAKVSVIIPVYNSAPYIRECLDSVQKQTLKEIEIIVINDGSCDESLEILEQYAQKDARFILRDQKNSGQSVCRNRGVTIASAPYICFVDSDDTIELEMLEQLLTTIKKSQSDIVTTAYKIISLDGSFSISSREFDGSRAISDPATPGYTCGYLYKKSLFTHNAIAFPEGIYFEDQLTSLELLFYAQKVISIAEPLYNYYMRQDSTTHTLSKQKIENIFDVIEVIEHFFKKKDLLEQHAVNITAKLLKLLNNYTLRSLLEKYNEDLAGYLYKKMQQSPHLKKEKLKKISQIHFGIHFDFITKLLMLEKRYPFVSILNSLLEPQILSHLKAQNSTIKEFSFANLLINHLLKHKIKKVVIYGCGAIYHEILPLLQEHAIEIIATIDANKTLAHTLTLEEFLQKHTPFPFVITSIAFAPEIEKKLASTIPHPHIISAKSFFA